ncbi:MAG: hypothetical protein HY235_02870 [Acidobacteria bacterium]|nr:hypothetical protein [Acidobacteriota bacterium]
MYDYLQQDLSSRDRRCFEARFLDQLAEGREFAKALLNFVSRHRNDATSAAGWTWGLFRGPVWQFTTVALAIAGVGVSFWLFRQISELRSQLSRAEHTAILESSGGARLAAELESQRQRSVALEQQIARPKPPLVLSFILSPGLSRDTDGLRQLQIPASADSVRLRLDLGQGDALRQGESGQAYRATLRKAGGAEVWNQDGLIVRQSTGKPSVQISLPAVLLPPSEYEILLTRTAMPGEMSDYHFGVVRP